MQLCAQDSSLQCVEAGIAALSGYVDVTLMLAVVSEHPAPLCNGGVRGRDRTGFAHGPEILSRIEAECRSVSKRAAPRSPVPRTVRLAGILDNLELELPSQRREAVPVGRMAIQIHRYQCRDAPATLALD